MVNPFIVGGLATSFHECPHGSARFAEASSSAKREGVINRIRQLGVTLPLHKPLIFVYRLDDVEHALDEL